MPFAPYQWRAGKGYIPPPDAVPQPIAMASPAVFAYPYGAPAQPQYSHLIVHAPGVVAAAPAPKKKKTVVIPPPRPSASAAPSKASSGPKTIVQGKDWRIVGKAPTDGKWTITIPPPPPKPETAPPQKLKLIARCTPPSTCSISPSDSVSSTGSGTSLGSTTLCKPTKTEISKETSSTKKTEITLNSHRKLRDGGSSPSPPPPPASTCPTLRPGVNYLFPSKSQHTILHIFNKASPIWEKKYEGKEMEFKMFKVGVKFTVREIVEKVLRKKAGVKDKDGNEELGKWCVTECHEQGGGVWKKGTTIAYSSDKAAGSLDSMGWDVKRGNERSPVWLVVHKA
ncbi:hypothetical protein Slin15195_G097130 [Septoria linicola]|uniref:Uncharacterized protein n=1 Tax=Septoria linicola TaxID=215465 RepID=A0A9Q9AWQ4_9PEZI|nr:hypothetical protein Slin15195_G097130 [Septoria linicola]